MGLGKTYSADYLIDSNGNTGVSGQVLISTATGIDWADGTAITGGPFLPLSAGSSYPLTNSLYLENTSGSAGASPSLYFKNGSGNFWRYLHESGGDFSIKEGTATRLTFKAGGNVGIGTTAPSYGLDVNHNAARIGSSAQTTTSLYLTATNTAGAPAVATQIIMQGYEGRAKGTFYTDSGNDGEWFNGIPYNGSHNYWQVGFDETGGQAEYRANAKLTIRDNGNVGIGTNSPGSPLDVKSNSASSADSGIRLIANGSTDIIAAIGEKSTNGARFHLYDGGTAKVSFYSDGTANYIAAGNVGIGTTAPGAKLQIGSATYAPNANLGNNLLQIKSPSGFAYLTIGNGDSANSTSYIGGASGFTVIGSVTDAGALSEHMRITNTGNVGIGTTSPGAKLDITTDHTSQIPIRVTHNNYNDWLIQKRRSDDTQKLGIKEVNSNGGMGFATADAVRMIIDSSGNVGIGTTSPVAKLDVDGVIRSRGGTYSADTDTRTDVGLIIPENYFIYTADGSDYLRKLIGKTSDIITIGEGGTSLIDGINLVPGGSGGYVQIFNNASVAAKFVDGKLGIGTTSPNRDLHVIGQIALDNAASSPSAGMLITADGTSNKIYSRTANNNSTPLAFEIISGASSSLYINSGGNVGIGETDPKAKLNITGVSGGPTVPVASSSDGIVRIESSNGGVGLDIGAQGASPYSMWMQVGNTSNSSGDTYPILLNPLGGNVGIGTTSPTQDLTLYRSSGDTNFLISSNNGASQIFFGDTESDNIGKIDYDHSDNSLNFAVNAAERMRITSAGNVGIGTTNPTAKLNVVHTASASVPALQIASSASLASNDIVRFQINGLTNGFRMFQDASSVLNYTFQDGNVGIGTTSPSTKLQISGGNSSTPATALFSIQKNEEGYGLFSGVLGTGVSWMQSATKTQSVYYGLSLQPNGGNVGIGTTSPGAKLDVAGQIITSDSVKFTGNVSTPTGNSVFRPASNTLAFGTASAERMRIDASGNVGIGTAAPTHKLHVNGNMRLTGALRDSNNATGSAGQVLSSTGSATDWISLPASSTVYTPKVYNLNNSTNINSQGQKLVPDFGTLEIEGNTTVEQVSGSDTDFQVSGEGAGIYEVTYAVFYKNTGNQRTPLGTYLTLNGTAVNGSLMVNYLRANVTGGGNWSSCTNTFYVDVTDASHPMALCVRRADSTTAPSGISMVEPAGMAVKSTISFRRIS